MCLCSDYIINVVPERTLQNDFVKTVCKKRTLEWSETTSKTWQITSKYWIYFHAIENHLKCIW